MRRIERKRLIRFTVTLLVVAGLAACWYGGAAGYLLAYRILPAVLPLNVGGDCVVDSIRMQTVMPECEKGLLLVVGTRHLKAAFKGTFPATWWLFPRGIIRDKVLISGRWSPSGLKMPDKSGMPLYISIDDSVGPHPKLSGRYPASGLNEVLKDEEAFNLRQTDEWALGAYELLYKITFDTAHIFSDTEVGSVPVEKRALNFDATGKVQLQFRETILNVSATADVLEFKGGYDVKFTPGDRGLILKYDARIDALRADVRNLAPWADEKISKELRRSLQKSMNRQKKKDQLAKQRFPSWLPTDILVDISVFSDQNHK